MNLTQRQWSSRFTPSSRSLFEPFVLGETNKNKTTCLSRRTALRVVISWRTPAPTLDVGDEPTDVAFAPDGGTIYVAAFGTDRLGILAPDGTVNGLIEICKA